MSWILNLTSGPPLSISAQNTLYGNGTPDVVGPFNLKSITPKLHDFFTSSIFDRGEYAQVLDPQCAQIAVDLRSSCSLLAIADGHSGQIILQNPLPGKRGTLGQRVFEGPGIWRLDASLRKEFKIRESKRLQLRVDARNVFNHPEPNTISTLANSGLILDINRTSFGQFVPAKSDTHRELQGQLRFSF